MVVKLHIKYGAILIALFAIALAAIVSTYTFASSVSSATSTANTLRVTPVRRDVTAQPGTSITVQATISNLSKGTVNVHSIENDFVAGDENGTPSLILDENTYAPTHSLKRFMVPLKDMTIEAGGSRTINVTINVPKTAQAGGYFGAVRFAPADPASGQQVNLSASVASLILLTVPGSVDETLSLTNFDIQQKGKNGASFGDSHDIAASIRFANKGNVQLAPFGKIAVMQGKTIIYETSFNTSEPHDVILPDSARKWTVPLNKIGSFGYYTVKATFTYGSKNQTIDVEKSFWVIPSTLIIAVIAGIGALGVILGLIWLGLSKYKRHILKKYGGGS